MFPPVSFICDYASRIQLLILLCESDSSISVVRVFLLFMRLQHTLQYLSTLRYFSYDSVLFLLLLLAKRVNSFAISVNNFCNAKKHIQFACSLFHSFTLLSFISLVYIIPEPQKMFGSKVEWQNGLWNWSDDQYKKYDKNKKKKKKKWRQNIKDNRNEARAQLYYGI